MHVNFDSQAVFFMIVCLISIGASIVATIFYLRFWDKYNESTIFAVPVSIAVTGGGMADWVMFRIEARKDLTLAGSNPFRDHVISLGQAFLKLPVAPIDWRAAGVA